jgi:hypothetical protein
MGIKIKLNEAEQKLATYLAKSRYLNARKRGKPNEKVGNQSDWETDLEGIGGELAACRYFNAYPDTDIDLDYLPKYDLITNKGKTVDVKTTKHLNGRLLATKKKKSEWCDIYVLVTGEFPTYNLVGWAYSEDLIKETNLIDLGHGEGYGLTQDNLRKFND